MAEGSKIVELSGALTIQNAGCVRDELMAALATGEDLTVDCRSGTEIDLTFVQLLLSARLTAEHNGHSLFLAAPLPVPLLSVLERGGFLGGDTADQRFWTKGRA